MFFVLWNILRKGKKKDFQNKLHISSESFPPEIQNNKHMTHLQYKKTGSTKKIYVHTLDNVDLGLFS